VINNQAILRKTSTNKVSESVSRNRSMETKIVGLSR